MLGIEYMDYEEQLIFQKRQFAYTLNYVMQNSEFYKNRLSKYKDIGIENIDELPIITKEDLLNHQSEIFCTTRKNYVDIVSTSGTTKKQRIVNPLTEIDLRRLAYNERISFEGTGITEDDIVLLTTALDGNFVAGYAYYLGIKEIGATVIRVGARNYTEQISMIHNNLVTTIVGVASNLVQMENYSKKNNLLYNPQFIKKLIIIGEAIRNRDLKLNQLGKRIQKIFPNADIYSTYANTECCLSFCECEGGCGGHLHPNLGYAEIVDNQGNVLPDGEIGRLIITTFGVQGMPLIRYDTGDLTFINKEQCVCGKRSLRIGPILGRTKQIIKLKGVSIGVNVLEEAILAIPSVLDYAIEVNNSSKNPLKIYVALSESNNEDEIRALVKESIWLKVRASSIIYIVGKEELINIQFKNNTRKPARIFFDESYFE